MYKHIKLTEQQAKNIHLKQLHLDWAFLVTKDINEDYFVDPYQVEQCTNPEFDWLKHLSLADDVPDPAAAQFQGSGSVNF